MIHGKYLLYSITKSDQSFNEQPNYFKLVTVYVTVYYVDNDFDKRDTINGYGFKWLYLYDDIDSHAFPRIFE